MSPQVIPVFPLNSEKLRIEDTGESSCGRAIFKLIDPLTFEYRINGGGFFIQVPKGFKTDFASIPRIFWSIFPPIGKYSRAAVIHDYLYQMPNCSRFLADAVFREAMFQLGVPTWKRLIIYYSVRIFGGLFRSKKTRK